MKKTGRARCTPDVKRLIRAAGEGLRAPIN